MTLQHFDLFADVGQLAKNFHGILKISRVLHQFHQLRFSSFEVAQTRFGIDEI